MSSTLKFLEKIAGPLTVAMLFRAYRKSNDMTLEDMASLLDVSKGFVSNIENNRKKLSLEKTLEFAAKMKEIRHHPPPMKWTISTTSSSRSVRSG